MTAYVALLLAGSLVFHPKNARPAYLACVVALTVLLLAVCWLKGERPAWRWGDDERRNRKSPEPGNPNPGPLDQ